MSPLKTGLARAGRVLALVALALPLLAHGQITFRAASQATMQSLPPKPQFQAFGAGVGNTGTVSPAWPAHLVNDVALMFCESAAQNITLTTANGFAAVTGTGIPPSTGAAAGVTSTRLHVFWARATTTAMAAPLVADPGDHVYCQILTYRGVVTTGNPWDVTLGGTKGAASTSVTVTGVTTTQTDTLVVQAAAHNIDNAGAQFSAQANANITFAERVDAGTILGNGGGIGVWDGPWPTAGATGNTTATVGNSVNAFVTIALAPAPQSPHLIGVGTGVGGAGAIAPAWPAHATDDIGLLFCESANQAISLTTPQGFAAVTGGVFGTGAAAGATSTRIQVFWARATSAAMAAPTVGDPGNHVYCQILAYRGVIASGNPWDVVGGGTKGATSTSVTVTGVTTTTNDTLVVQAASHNIDSAAAQFSAIANGTLSGLAERADAGTTQGNGGGIAAWDGVMASAGATNNTTATVGNSVNAFVTIALVPEPPRIAVPTGTLQGDLMVAAIAVRPSTTLINAPSGWTAETVIVQGTGNTSRQQIFWRVADAADAAGGVSYQWTFSGASVGAAGTIVSYSGVDTASASPIDVIGGNTTASNTTHQANGVTTTVPNTMVITTHAFASSETWTPPAGMTERVDIASETPANTAGISLEFSEVIQATAAGTGDRIATAAGNADTGTAQILALRPAYTHYGVSYPNGSDVATCEPALVRIEAHHGAHGLAAPPAGTVMNLVTSTATGVWQAGVVTGNPGGWVSSGLDNGAATYTWPGNEAVLEVRLRHNTVTTLNINITETPAGNTEGTGTEDPTLNFANTVLRVTADGSSSANIGTQIAAKRSDTGAGAQTLFVQAVATSPATGACTTLFQNQTLNVDFAAQCNSPTACSAVAGTDFELRNSGGTFTSVAKNDGPGAPGTYTAVSLAFSNDANAMAPLVVRYGDAGQTTLHMRYSLPTPPATTITGSSNAFVTRPFAFAFRGANATTPIQHGADQTSGILVPAGDNFTMTIAAYKWVQAEDDGTGNPLAAADVTDNTITPSFAASVTVAPSANLAGVAGSMSRGATCASAATIASGEFSGGVATINDWCYSEVGNVLLTATATDYISTGITVSGNSGLDDTNGSNGHVGRFRPKQFALSAGSITNRAALTCPGATWTYMSERLDLGFTLAAQNTQGTTTANYTGAYALLGLGTIANYNLGARSGTANLTTRINTGGGSSASGSWSNGVASNIAIQTSILRSASPDGPLTATSFGIAPSNDGVSMNTLDLDVDNNAANDHKTLGVSTEFRFGRLRLQNALASSGAVVLPVPMELQHWVTSPTAGFVTNTDDSCTSIPTGIVTLAPTLSGGSTSVSSTTFAAGTGRGFIRLAAPGAGNSGYVLVTPDLTVAGVPVGQPNRAYLQGTWTSGGSWNENPTARGSWGLFGGQPQNFIYQRENY